MKNLFYFFLLLGACNIKSSNNVANKIGDELSYNLEFQFSISPNKTSTQSRMLQLVDLNGKEFLYFGDSKSKNRILIFDINDGSFHDEISFESNGPNGIGKMSGFYYQSDDSIFIINSYKYELFHTNSQGEIIKSYNIKGNTPQEAILPHPTQNPIGGIAAGKIFIYGVGEKNPYDKDYYNDLQVSKSINISSGEMLSGVKFPDKYHNNYFHLSTSINIYQELIGQNILQSFSSEDNVYLFNRDFKHISNISIPHSRVLNMGPVKKDLINSDEGYYLLYSSGAYRNTLFDKYSNLIYRFAIIPPKNPDRFDNFRELKDNILPGLVIYDYSNNSILGEISFLDNEIDQFPMYFIGSKGLYLSKESKDENRVDFYLLKITNK